MTATITDRYEHLKTVATHRMEWADRTETTGGGLAVISGMRIWDLTTGTAVDFVDLPEWANNTEIIEKLNGGGYEALSLKFLRKIAVTPGR
ncbi:hypothetical protein [Gordonia sihwensis]|uniref:hypothetical protein n=1 Tax=Gordonia sihwensis TaxID=173559 RepID=UPI0005EFBAEF|nr:hypothetical protein [Gordonia sihwensis]KJR10275.1 hypothetical protein UG54_01465 [Gordonia sihwensis]